MESVRTFRLMSLLTLVLYVAIQTFGLTAPWFPADDAQELAFVRSMDGWIGLLGVDSFGLFRPFKNLLFLIFIQLEPLGMPAVHAFAIAIGVLSFFPVRAFFRCVLNDDRLALLGAAMWLLSPTLVSSVAWLSCLNIQLMCAFVAGAFVCHDRGRYLGSALLIFLACTSYECAVATGPCLVVFDYFLREDRFRNRRTWVQYAVYAAVTLGFLVVRHFVGSAHSVNGSFANCSRLDIVFASAYFCCQHFLSWLWPFGRMAVFGGYVAGGVSVITLIGCWVLLIASAVFALYMRRRNPVLAFGIVLALVGFLPVSNVSGAGNGPYGDYYLGIASFGLAAALTSLCCVNILRFLVPLVRLVAVGASFHWAMLWARGNEAYFASIENFPGFFGNEIFLVSRLCDAELWDEALQLGKNVEEIVGSDSGQMSGVHIVRGLHALRAEKNAEKAISEFEKSRKANDFSDKLCNRDYYLGCVYDDLLNDQNRAAELYESSLRGQWNVDSAPAADRLACILTERGEFAAAIELWQRALRIKPGDVGMLHNLNVAKARQEKANVAVP